MINSYQKYADDFFNRYNKDYILREVDDKDYDEIMVFFSIKVSHLEYADNFRIFKLKDKALYYKQAEKGCCGSWDTQYVCKSGNIYLLGCNYGH